MSPWGCWGLGAAEGEGHRGAGPSLEFVSVVSDQGSLSSSCPQSMGQNLSGLRVCVCVCVSGKGRRELTFLCPLTSVSRSGSLSGSVCPSLRVSASFLAPLHLSPLNPPPFAISSSTRCPTPHSQTARRAPPSRQGGVDLGGPVSPGGVGSGS